ncbi:MAG TPA: choice-of-anchor B family protein [Saprospiraceae bacterium]|nr:choice-of-anchor B family protein [Saprospiraceae bacterium]
MKSFLFCLLIIPSLAHSQQSLNMTFLSNFDIPNLPIRFGAEYNDCWGYTHPTNGTEVAIIGGIEDIFFVNITSPANPVLIYTHHVTNIDGTTNQSLWRDFKTYQNYVYAAADEGDSGLLIFNLSNVPNSVTLVTQTNAFWSTTHNIHIDVPGGRLYAAGSNTQNNGLKILSLATPTNPTLLASVPLNTYGGGYVHDVYVKNHIAYCSHGSLSKLQIYNMTNLSNITIVGTIDTYPEPGYNHSSWVNDAGNMLVMADETHGSDLKLIDITDPMNISANDIHTFYSELLGAGAPGSSIAHNPFIKGDLAFIAYYHDGVQVFNISNPLNIVKVAYYDTYPENTGYAGYEGCWGVYPYFPSGMIIASDQTHGLYVLQVTTPPLGINFLAFDAAIKNEDVQLDWVIGDASFGNKFEVKRSVDHGKTFEKIGTVIFSETETRFRFTDENVAPGQGYLYRIEFVELDGNRISSPTRSVQSSNKLSTLKVVNPTSSKLILDLMNPVESLDLKIYDMEGKLIWTQKDNNPTSHMEKDIHELVPGHYLLAANWLTGNESVLLQVIK